MDDRLVTVRHTDGDVGPAVVSPAAGWRAATGISSGSSWMVSSDGGGDSDVTAWCSGGSSSIYDDLLRLFIILSL